MSGLALHDVSIRKGGRLVVRNVSFRAGRGQLLALMGPSGTGKTTVLRGVAGLDPLAEGEIALDGLRLVPGPVPRGSVRRALYRRVGMVFQFHHLFAHLTALDNVCLAPIHVRRDTRDVARQRAAQLLGAVGVAHLASSLPHQLSGGEAQRVAIARALAVDPPVLLLDEPTASLDEGRREELAGVLRGLASEGRTMLVSTHDRAFARMCADSIVYLEDGQVRRPEGTAPASL